MDIFAAIAADPNVDPALRALFDPARDTRPQANLLTRRAAIQEARRFDAEPLTGFGSLDDELFRRDRYDERGDTEAHQRDDRREREESGE